VPAQVSVASLNLHGGVDGWGRPFDVVEACRSVGADVLALQEVFSPDGGPGTAEVIADELGYRAAFAPMGRARRYPPVAEAGAGWGPLLLSKPGVGMKTRTDGHRGPSERGVLGMALLSRLAMAPPAVVDLGRLLGDPVRRLAVTTRVECAGASLFVAATHMSHLKNGSIVQLQRLRRRLPEDSEPGVLLGDMNLWGPPLSLGFPGWSRAVRGRSWPAWRPVFQIDHVLVSRAVQVDGGEVLPTVGSDHRPIRAVLSVR
jgi:endonuclease/exonuclease/phosphatase family metal-dependent hydrolase